LYCFRIAFMIGFLVWGTVSPGQTASLEQAGAVQPMSPVMSVVVNLPSRTLELYFGEQIVKIYPVAVGKPSTPTPLGQYAIIEKEVNPAWYPPGSGTVVPSGPANPLGYRWMGFISTYGIHGTNAPASIGKMVSNGCIRMQEADVEELYDQLPLHAQVQITYERVKVTADKSGLVMLAIYPDVYGYHRVTAEEVKCQLARYGACGWIKEDILRSLIAEASGQPTPVIRTQEIRIFNKKIPAQAVAFENQLYVPIWPVAVALGFDVVWDGARRIVRVGTAEAQGEVRENRIYINADTISRLFHVESEWSVEGTCLFVN